MEWGNFTGALKRKLSYAEIHQEQRHGKEGTSVRPTHCGNNDESPEANLNIGERGPGASKRQGKNPTLCEKDSYFTSYGLVK